MKRIILKKDIVIPAGTVFECCDGVTRRFASGNYETTLGLTKNTSGSFVYGFEEELLDEWFTKE